MCRLASGLLRKCISVPHPELGTELGTWKDAIKTHYAGRTRILPSIFHFSRWGSPHLFQRREEQGLNVFWTR